jgi:hypothetical protein
MRIPALRIGMYCALAALAACGSDTPTSTVDNNTARGTLVDNPPFRIASLSAVDFDAVATAHGPPGVWCRFPLHALLDRRRE